jgi:peptide/nickel transport system substrate-binding protein
MGQTRTARVALAALAAVTLGVSGVAGIGAQEGVPAASPAATFEPLRSISREEYAQQLFAAYPMQEPTQEGGQLIWGDSTDISTVNPVLGADQPTNPFLSLVFESMTATNPVDGQPVPGLADSWERAADGVTYTFFLSKEATWHDGTDFSADDVIFSLDAQLNPETGSQYTSTVDAAVESYRKIDADTVEVVSDGPRANFLFDLIAPVVPKHIWEGVPAAEWATDPGSTGQDPARVVGTGPFRFVEWVQGDHATIERNADYWDTVSGRVPTIERLTLQVFPDETTQIQALRTGQIDFVERVPPAEVAGLQSDPNLQVVVYPTFDFGFYYMNLDPARTELFQDRRVREALFRSLDRQAIIDSIFLGLGEVAVGTQSLLSTAYAPDRIENAYEYDLDAARALLDEAGWVDGDGDGIRELNGQPFSFEMTYSEGVATYEQLVPYMQQQFRDIGVDMQPNPVPFPTLLDTLNKSHDYQMMLLGFSWVADPDQKTMFACDQYMGGFNSGRYCNEAYDELAYAADRELDPERRNEILIEASQIVWDDLPIGILRFSEAVDAATVRMVNYYPNDYAYTIWSMPWVFLSE